ncbi:MAG: conjugal transfer protein TrbI [Stigonema ocellatum SAG 48.90 = DSM 106950]|nr:conjugal transfer protein TrbI [Stigonema ocellatum SAG 48.90 = DSM 106950]
MFISQGWQHKTITFIALGTISTANLQIPISHPAQAATKFHAVGQKVAQSNRLEVRDGTVIPIQYNKAEKVIITPDETQSLTLTVARDIRTGSGRVAIPAGSKIEGKLKPVSDGTQFVAQTLVLNSSNQRLSIDATSRVVTRKQTITNKNDSDITKGAIVGAGAAALLGQIFGGRIRIGEVLGGGATGALAGTLLRGSKRKEVVLIYPNRDLKLTVNSNLVIYE